jgi:hypothetical protein
MQFQYATYTVLDIVMDSLVKFFSLPEVGTALTLLEIAISLVGFAAAIWSSRQSKIASERAEAAVNKVREDIRKIDTVSDLSTAITSMDEIKRRIREGSIVQIPDRCMEVRRSLIIIQSANPELAATQKSRINVAIRQLSSIEEVVDQCLITGKPLDGSAVHLKVLSKQVDNILSVLTEIKNTIGG